MTFIIGNLSLAVTLYYSGSSKIAFYAFGGILIPMTVILFTNLKIKASYFKKGLKSVLDLAAIATILGC